MTSAREVVRIPAIRRPLVELPPVSRVRFFHVCTLLALCSRPLPPALLAQVAAAFGLTLDDLDCQPFGDQWGLYRRRFIMFNQQAAEDAATAMALHERQFYRVLHQWQPAQPLQLAGGAA